MKNILEGIKCLLLFKPYTTFGRTLEIMYGIAT